MLKKIFGIVLIFVLLIVGIYYIGTYPSQAYITVSEITDGMMGETINLKGTIESVSTYEKTWETDIPGTVSVDTVGILIIDNMAIEFNTHQFRVSMFRVGQTFYGQVKLLGEKGESHELVKVDRLGD
jgi:hypothetical protein